MPRTARAAVGGLIYHVISRGNDRARVFHTDGDYWAFCQLIGEACVRLSMGVLAYCLMPNHFHLVLWPNNDGDLSSWMDWLLSTHARRYRRFHDGWGHIWGERFKSFPVQGEDHLMTVVRYVERNPVTAELRTEAKEWRWSSARWRESRTDVPAWLTPYPGGLPKRWLDHVDESVTAAEYQRYLTSLERQSPFGDPTWIAKTAQQLGLESTLRPRGRPKAA
jgi:putative transposase